MCPFEKPFVMSEVLYHWWGNSTHDCLCLTPSVSLPSLCFSLLLSVATVRVREGAGGHTANASLSIQSSAILSFLSVPLSISPQLQIAKLCMGHDVLGCEWLPNIHAFQVTIRYQLSKDQKGMWYGRQTYFTVGECFPIFRELSTRVRAFPLSPTLVHTDKAISYPTPHKLTFVNTGDMERCARISLY